MIKNYLETLRFTLVVKNLSDRKFNPIIKVGLNNDENHEFKLTDGVNKFIFDEKVHFSGTNSLTVRVVELPNRSHDINSFQIEDLSINGISVTYRLFQCIYYPYYDRDYLLEKPDAPKEITGGLYVGNRGKWQWFFDAPVNENSSLKFGLW